MTDRNTIQYGMEQRDIREMINDANQNQGPYNNSYFGKSRYEISKLNKYNENES